MLGSLVFFLGSAALAAAHGPLDTFMPSVHMPGDKMHDLAFHAANWSFFVGLEGPMTKCPPEIMHSPSGCPPKDVTVVGGLMTHMAVAVPAGQNAFVHANGSVGYTKAHHGYGLPDGAVKGGWMDITPKSKAEPGMMVLDWVDKAGKGMGGVFMCPVSEPMGATHQLYVGMAGFMRRNCVKMAGLGMKPTNMSHGAWQYQ